jgi:hypothetical protein
MNTRLALASLFAAALCTLTFPSSASSAPDNITSSLTPTVYEHQEELAWQAVGFLPFAGVFAADRRSLRALKAFTQELETVNAMLDSLRMKAGLLLTAINGTTPYLDALLLPDVLQPLAARLAPHDHEDAERNLKNDSY